MSQHQMFQMCHFVMKLKRWSIDSRAGNLNRNKTTRCPYIKFPHVKPLLYGETDCLQSRGLLPQNNFCLQFCYKGGGVT